MSPRATHVYGPAYLDRVLLVGRPLHRDGEAPLDQSVEGVWEFGPGLTLRDAAGATIEVEPPPGWPGPGGTVTLSVQIPGAVGAETTRVRAIAWHDDLGGMGAGYAAALGGELVSALGAEDDPVSLAVSERLRIQKIRHRPIRVSGHAADWTLLLTSGPHGDKLPVGFRGCHAAMRALEGIGPCDLRVVASFPNRLAAQALRAPGANARLFAPAMRNMTDGEPAVARFAEFIDLLCCNRREWETLVGREDVAWQVSVLAVTDGANGAVVRSMTPQGEATRLEIPAFPRTHPPRDTNRAGEAFGSTLAASLLDGGWSPGGGVEPDLVRHAAERASAAAALVLDRTDFGFPTREEVDAAVVAGRVGAPPDDAAAGSAYNAGGPGAAGR